MSLSRWKSSATLALGALALSVPLLSAAAAPSFRDLSVTVTDLDARMLRPGREAEAMQLNVKPGMPGQLIQERLGSPSKVGHIGTKTYWDYNISFPIAGGSSRLVCQYKVVLTDGTVSSTHWRRPVCQDLHVNNHL